MELRGLQNHFSVCRRNYIQYKVVNGMGTSCPGPKIKQLVFSSDLKQYQVHSLTVRSTAFKVTINVFLFLLPSKVISYIASHVSDWGN